ncbi:nucleotidyltransferase domain-containing protein [Cohnella silvisoli]|uniref:Nucleotidyltransferase domain-containing protein n=1 Tax=Cohnella silvisoli TaxID=2873699 RepID=A0ABV1KQU6_9BACL|nr:nucleotidyltransferase domain-containing protein [Cohnella silvisoli]MCD9021991.1 nucleotidyltransferase domain-containing protein [Cohnella silvisoli]
MVLPIHMRFIEHVKESFIQDKRIIGLLAGGSMIYGTMDEYSDLDLIVVYQPAYQAEIMKQRLNIVEKLGSLLSAFTGEHVGEPRLVICLYGPSPLHVDFKFVTPEELAERIEQPLILWERGIEISTILQHSSPNSPSPDPQWNEDRFWVWIHYGATKLGRGELFEVIDLLTFIRSVVLGPLILTENGQLPRGVRRLEQHAGNVITELEETIPSHNSKSCYNALQSTIRLYQNLRYRFTDLVLRKEAEQVSIAYLEKVYSSLSTK